jgi:hypothetical protein
MLELTAVEERTQYKTVITLQMQVGLTIFCCCHLRKLGMRVSLTCLDPESKFWKWTNGGTVISLVKMSDYNWVEASEACNQLARDEWAVVAHYGPQTGDNFAHYRILDRRHQIVPACSHSHDIKPKPPAWYLTLFSARDVTDIFSSDLYIDQLFRSEENVEEGVEEARDASPLVPVEEQASLDQEPQSGRQGEI